MTPLNRWPKLQNIGAFALLALIGIGWTARFLMAQPPSALEPAFEQQVKPFLKQNCVRCHNADLATSGVRVDQLDAALDDRHLKLWEAIRHRVHDGTMPPKGMPQPANQDRQQLLAWVDRALDVARSRPLPKNGLVRRLTVAQYRNTLRELLKLEDDLTETLPPDAVSRDGFVNNKETLQLNPLLLESYLEIAGEALTRSIVDPKSKPKIQNFRVDFGAGINKDPLKEELVLGANSHLLENKDFTVTQLTATKPFPFDPFFMQTKYRFIEGYQGNDTVRGWREYDSIYHSVFACMRGSMGYPKGLAYSAAPQGLLLRPAIPNEENFDADGTYGPKANFKISLRELPDNGRFRVTVTAAKYNDGLLLDSAAKPQPDNPNAITVRDFNTVTIKQPGIYQIDAYAAPRTTTTVAPDATRLTEGLAGSWNFNNPSEGPEQHIDSPFGKALTLTREASSVAIPRTSEMDVADGEFTIAAWIQPRGPRKAGLIHLGAHDYTQGWRLDLPDNRGTLRLETAGPGGQPNGSVSSTTGVIRVGAWQHVAAVVRRGKNETRLYVNGFLVAKGEIGAANLDNPKMNLHLGGLPNVDAFRGELDEVRLYRRALGEAELQALVEPGRQFAKAPVEKPQQLTLNLGGREFANTFQQPALLAVRLEAGPLPLSVKYAGAPGIERLVLTPLAASSPLAQKFAIFEKRVPKIGVHLGLRRDCGSTLIPVGEPRPVSGDKLTKYIFEGAIRNFPSPDVEKDNVNYLAGVREIAVRSEYTDGRDMPRLLIRSIEFEGPFYEAWPPASHKAIFPDTPRKPEEIIRSFATRAFRRPITPKEETALMAVYQKSSSTGRNFQDSIKDALQVALTSPQFLFLVETSQTPAAEPLENHELASKLSYFLWNGPPDTKTLQLAANGTLRTQIDTEVNRMIDDPRFTRFTKEFAAQWLNLEKFQVLEADRKRYPKLTRATRIELQKEPVQFVQYLMRHNLPVQNLIASDFILANEAVATYYDLAGKSESGFQFLAIPTRRPDLGGVLTQAAIMAGLSDGRESNPVKRGAWLARKIIAEPPDDPPPNVPVLKEDAAGKLTLRQRLERHRNQPGCAQCHAKIDPWGVPFEEYDAGGRKKTETVDASSQLPDKTEIKGTDDLKRYLSNDRIDQVAFSFLKHLTVYATGRTLSYNELNFLKKDALSLKLAGYRMKDMIRYVAHSKMFLEK